MKINWGTGIVIIIVSFMGFISYFVISMSIKKEFKHDLVTEKYYEKELGYQDQINATKNGFELEENITVLSLKEGLRINFPKKFIPTEIQGKVFLYRPSNKLLDFEIPISLSKTYLLVPEKRLLEGRWNISVSWSYENKEYFFNKELNR
ncbi:cytochrome C oxidase Cbb3 [Polaribacter sp. SA4-10]|uniref:FixH family protein n=1 Tax=Polaribacter sp. SA4-10 TaxID=754397 RepID=UPI000B3C7510|nr:FixH family protein [Polaribacter sp. SA4-10]ARV06537.1 cytochrome C oxidase Cbb3 [Polaribacter sp. SA4-10]